MRRTQQRRRKGTREANPLRFVTVIAQVVYIFLYVVPPTAYHDIMLQYADDPQCRSANCP